MAKRKPGPHLIIANRLDDGRAIFMTEEGDWTPNPKHAAFAEGEAIDALEALAAKSNAANLVIDPLAVPADAETGPAHIKQKMQVHGPSVRPDLGYQAKNA